MLIQDPITAEAESAARLRVVRYFSDVCSKLVPDNVREAHVRHVRELEATTDEELDEIGILRDHIVGFVFAEAHYV